MRAIILAAGKGSRISDSIGAIPKSLLKINGKTIIENTVEKLADNGAKVSVCVGYRHRLIRDVLKDKNVTFYYNPFYDLMNNIGSIWFAKEEFDKNEDVLILSADVIFENAILEKLIESDSELIMAADTSRIRDGDYFFTLNKCGDIADYGADIPEERRSCEYIGLSKLKSSVCEIFKDKLEEIIETGGTENYFEKVFFSFIGNRSVSPKTIDVKGLNWREIDFYNDYQKALEQF